MAGLTDGQGRTVDFKQHAHHHDLEPGAEYLVAAKEDEDMSAARGEVMDMVRGHFRPEFLNRLDEIILFHRLKRRTWAPSSTSSWAACRSCWKIARSRWT
jgi:ATP-dependent Clp protease ATP-binding subunit ClpB